MNSGSGSCTLSAAMPETGAGGGGGGGGGGGYVLSVRDKGQRHHETTHRRGRCSLRFGLRFGLRFRRWWRTSRHGRWWRSRRGRLWSIMLISSESEP